MLSVFELSPAHIRRGLAQAICHLLRVHAALKQRAGWSRAASWTVFAISLETLTVILAAIVCAGVVIGVHAVAFAKLGECHLSLWEQALDLHDHYTNAECADASRALQAVATRGASLSHSHSKQLECGLGTADAAGSASSRSTPHSCLERTKAYQGVQLLWTRGCRGPSQQDGPLCALHPWLGILRPPGLQA